MRCCDGTDHWHCNYCEHVQPRDGNWKVAYEHIRECHPAVWDSDHGLRAEYSEWDR